MPNLPRSSVVAAIVLALGALPSATHAVEVRQPESQWQIDERIASYVAHPVRAYAPCTAPNDVAPGGVPACTPAITSPCNLRFDGNAFSIEKDFETHRIHAKVVIGAGGPPECATGTYYLDLAIRTSADSSAACPSRHCTFPDTVLHLPMSLDKEVSDQKLVVLLPFETTEQDVQVLGFTIFDPDGLPLATASATNGPEVLVSNATVPYAACTTPGPGGACDAAPWSSVCDFEVGALSWGSDATFVTGSTAHAILRDLAGASPLCTTGIYQVDATYRVTAAGCASGARCTTIDQHVTLPLAANGRDLDGTSHLDLGAFPIVGTALEIVAARVLDPLGAPIAASGVSEVRSLVRPKITIRPDRLQLRATFPLPFLATALDPTEPGGLGIEVTNRNGTVFAVTIPPERWQLQPPIGSRWDYKDRGGVLNGVRKARIKWIVKQHRLLGYTLELDARALDLADADFPGINVNVTLPGLPSGTFQAQQHRRCRVKTSKLDCR